MISIIFSSILFRGKQQSHRRASRGSAATDRPSASATSCAAEHCTATERRCVANAVHARADHVVSSYSDAVSLLARHSAPWRSSSSSAGPIPPNVSIS